MIKKAKKTCSCGFTLVEVLIGLAFVGIAMGAVYSTQVSQTRTVSEQVKILEVQQKLRVGIGMLERELRMAGYDPSGSGLPDIVSAGSDYLYLTKDVNGDGDIDDQGEHLAFCSFNGSLGLTVGADASVGNITPSHTHNHFPVFEGLDGLQLFYTLADGTETLSPASPSEIRSIQVALLVRSAGFTHDYRNTETYTMPSGAVLGPFNDSYRRRLLSTSVMCRNMGL